MRLFCQRGLCATGRLLPAEDFVLFRDLKTRQIPGDVKARQIRLAENVMKVDYPVLTASDFLRFASQGDRAYFERLYFMRRDNLFLLLNGELCEEKGRFSDRILDLVWMLLEETSWVIPAHAFVKESALSYNPGGIYDNIDLFAAETAATVAWVYYYADRLFPEFAETVKNYIRDELQKRIFDPLMRCDLPSWMGYRLPGHLTRMNNWGPWVSSNLLLVTALCVEDAARKERHTDRLMEILDNYIDGFGPDGGCEEGPGYWSAAAGALFDALEILYDMSGGSIDVFDEPLIRNIGEYIAAVNVAPDVYVPFSDAHAKIHHDFRMISRFGRRTGSKTLLGFGTGGLFAQNADAPLPEHPHYHSYRCRKNLFDRDYKKTAYTAPEQCWMESIQVMVQRGRNSKPLFFAMKGGNNRESHNHNDVGSFVLYAGGEPVLIDVGSGTYTRATFDLRVRYGIWNMQSSYHNLPEIDGVMQKAGSEFCAENVACNREERSLCMALEKAYPDPNLKRYTRKAVFSETRVTITDRLELEKEGKIAFCFMLADPPTLCVPGKAKLAAGLTMFYDASLRAEVEEIPLDDPVMTENWNRNSFFRLRLSCAQVREKTFEFAVEST